MVAAANDTEYGLVAYVYTNDLRRALRVAEAIETGMVGLNQGVVSNPAAPFGGVKQSGLGREGGAVGIDEFLESKYIGIAHWPDGSGLAGGRDGRGAGRSRRPCGRRAAGRPGPGVAVADRLGQGAVLADPHVRWRVGLLERVDAHPGLGDAACWCIRRQPRAVRRARPGARGTDVRARRPRPRRGRVAASIVVADRAAARRPPPRGRRGGSCWAAARSIASRAR